MLDYERFLAGLVRGSPHGDGEPGVRAEEVDLDVTHALAERDDGDLVARGARADDARDVAAAVVGPVR